MSQVTVGHTSIRDATIWMVNNYEHGGGLGGVAVADQDGVVHVPVDCVVGDQPWIVLKGKPIYQWLHKDVYSAWRTHVARTN